MKYKFLSLPLAFAVILAAAAIPVYAVEPVSMTGISGNQLSFDTACFLLGDIDESELQGIIITELPSDGQLCCDGRNLLQGEAVTFSALNALRYVPDGNYAVETQFSYLPVFSNSIGSEPVTIEITMERKDNKPPVAQNMEVKTYKNIAVTEIFKASDPDGDPLTFRITTKSKRGEVEILEGNNFRYTPYKNKTGSDSITYVAVDSYGNTSAEAKIIFKIDKPSTKTTYSDMEGQPAHYAAIRLIEKGVFTGEQLCGKYYFNAGNTVTRGEFITMVMKATGAAAVPTMYTGFSDDSSTPEWVKAYAQAALKSGVISGVESADGRKYLLADKDISLAEALIMINNAIRVADVANVYPYEDSAVPVWAAQAVSNMEAAGIVEPQLLDWVTPVSRGEAAEMLCRAIDVYSASQKSGGLLSWVFGW